MLGGVDNRPAPMMPATVAVKAGFAAESSRRNAGILCRTDAKRAHGLLKIAVSEAANESFYLSRTQVGIEQIDWSRSPQRRGGSFEPLRDRFIGREKVSG